MMEIDLQIVKQERLAKLFVSMGNRTRVAVLESLACHNQCMKKDIVQVPGLSKYTVGQNLKELKKHGIVNGSFTSKNLSYCIDYRTLEEFKTLFDGFYERLTKYRKSVNPDNVLCGE